MGNRRKNRNNKSKKYINIYDSFNKTNNFQIKSWNAGGANIGSSDSDENVIHNVIKEIIDKDSEIRTIFCGQELLAENLREHFVLKKIKTDDHTYLLIQNDIIYGIFTHIVGFSSIDVHIYDEENDKIFPQTQECINEHKHGNCVIFNPKYYSFNGFQYCELYNNCFNFGKNSDGKRITPPIKLNIKNTFKNILVFSVHFPYSPNDAKKRNEMIRRYFRFVSCMRSCNDPGKKFAGVVFAGDFNVLPEDFPKYDNSSIKKAAFKPKYNNTDVVTNIDINNNFMGCLDYIFFDSHEKFYMHNSQIQWLSDNYKIYDHAMISTFITL